jgi:hypothetical protein
VTVASSKIFDLVKGLGADSVFDYHNEGIVEKIHATTGNVLDIAIDTILEDKTPAQVTGAIGDEGEKVTIILPYECSHPTFNKVPDFVYVRCNLPFLCMAHPLSREPQADCMYYHHLPLHVCYPHGPAAVLGTT